MDFGMSLSIFGSEFRSNFTFLFCFVLVLVKLLEANKTSLFEGSSASKVL